jgi:RNA polymerase sigma-70 factor (ECF subfamily)
MSASLASDLRTDFEPRSAIHARPYLELVPPPPEPEAERFCLDERELRELLPSLRRRALRWCRDATSADDLVQETLLRACGRAPEFENQGHAQAWLYTVLHNLFVSRARREQSGRRALSQVGAALDHDRSGAGDSAPGFLLPSLQRALEALPEPFASALRLVDMEDHSYAEAAALLGVPVGTVMSRLFRGRRRLALALVETRDGAA